MLEEYIALDAHKRYSLVERWDGQNPQPRQFRVEHHRGAIHAALQDVPAGTPVAVEATGNWYWIVDEIEQPGLQARLTHPGKAKAMMGCLNKTDELDVHGLNRLQKNGTLPTVWIPPGQLRDLRELTRGRMVLARHRTRLKNRISATLAKYALVVQGHSDSYAAAARPQLQEQVRLLPRYARWMSRLLLQQLDLVEKQIQQQERRLRTLVKHTPQLRRLMSQPGVGLILAAVMLWEVGDVGRFASAERLAAYAGVTPRVHASGDKVRYGPLRPDVNRYLKWALVEAANAVAVHARAHPQRFTSQRYLRLRQRRGHPKAIGAVARHLAEAVYHVLHRKEDYRDPYAGRTMGDVSVIVS